MTRQRVANIMLKDIPWDGTELAAPLTLPGALLAPSYVEQAQIVKPANPTAGKMRFYPKSDGQYYKLDSAGVETIMGGLTQAQADARYVQQTAIDPFPVYLTKAEGDGYYDALGAASAAIAAHNATADPHPQYLTPAEGDQRYALEPGGPSGGYLTKTAGDSYYVDLVGDTMSGSLLFSPTNTADIGDTTHRPRTVYAGTSFIGPGAVPSGGAIAQVLVKNSAADYDYSWGAGFTQGQADARYLQLTGGTLTGTLNGTAIRGSSGIYATSGYLHTTDGSNGIVMSDNGTLYVRGANGLVLVDGASGLQVNNALNKNNTDINNVRTYYGMNNACYITSDGSDRLTVANHLTISYDFQVNRSTTLNGGMTVFNHSMISAATGGIGSTGASEGQLELQNAGSGAAKIAFHRTGAYAAYFGLDTDNQWAVGGWSMGGARYIMITDTQTQTLSNKTLATPSVVGNLTVSSGYIYASYINLTADVPGGKPVYVAGNNGDGFLRWWPIAAVGPPGSGTTPISVSAYGSLSGYSAGELCRVTLPRTGTYAIVFRGGGSGSGGRASYSLNSGDSGSFDSGGDSGMDAQIGLHNVGTWGAGTIITANADCQNNTVGGTLYAYFIPTPTYPG